MSKNNQIINENSSLLGFWLGFFGEIWGGFWLGFFGGFWLGLYDALNIVRLSRLIYRSTRIRGYLYKTLFVYLFLLSVGWLSVGWLSVSSWNNWNNQNKIGGYFLNYTILFLLSIYHHFVTKNLWISIFATYDIKSSNKLDIWYFIAESIYGFIFSCIFKLQNNIIGLLVELFVKLFIGKFGTLGTLGMLFYGFFTIVTSAFIISWSSYEYKLIYMNKPLVKRIRNFEKRWLYFLGFGLPYALILRLGNSSVFTIYILNTLCTIQIIETKPQKTLFYSKLFVITHYFTDRIIDILRTFFGKPKGIHPKNSSKILNPQLNS